MFRPITKVPTRKFSIDLKHRPKGDDGSNEELIEAIELLVPRLKNSDLERQWVVSLIWQKLFEPEYQERRINQAFVFTADYGEPIVRLETEPFHDEVAVKLEAPSTEKFEDWQARVEKQFKKIYGFSIKDWNGKECRE